MIGIGMGGSSSSAVAEFEAALTALCRDVGRCDVVATHESAACRGRVEDAALRVGARFLSVPIAALLERNDECETRSSRSLEHLGIYSVAEAAALVAAGAGSRLIAPRRILGGVTIAAARSEKGAR